MTILCDYGCGQEAKHQLKNGKWCCSKSYNSCPEVRKNNSKKHIGKNKEKTYEEIYGKEKAIKLIEIRRKSISGSKNPMKRSNVVKKMKETKKGCKTWISGLTKETNKSVKQISEKLKGKSKKIVAWNKGKRGLQVAWNKGLTKETNESLRKVSEKLKGKKKLDQSKYMKNGGSIHANKFVKSPSKPQVKIYKMVKEEFNSAEIEFPFITKDEKLYRLDIIIPEYKIVIEYDGSYWHQDKEKDLERQRECEDCGWKFIRYEDIVPTKEQVIEDINNLVKEREK